MGRTELQDAVPMTVGQEFHAFAASLDGEIQLLQRRGEVPLRGQHGRHRDRHRHQRAQGLRREVRRASWPSSPASRSCRPTDMLAATWDQQGFVVYSAALKSLAIKLSKIAERPDPARLRPARRPGRDQPAGAAARLVDHAGQGQPGHARGGEHRRLPRDGQRLRGRRSPRTAGSSSSTPTSRSKGSR